MLIQTLTEERTGVFNWFCCIYNSDWPLTVEELDDVSEVHVVVHDDLTVNCNQSQGKKEDKVAGGNPGRHPDHLPDGEHVLVQELCARTDSSTSAHFSTRKPQRGGRPLLHLS